MSASGHKMLIISKPFENFDISTKGFQRVVLIKGKD